MVDAKRIYVRFMIPAEYASGLSYFSIHAFLRILLLEVLSPSWFCGCDTPESLECGAVYSFERYCFQFLRFFVFYIVTALHRLEASKWTKQNQGKYGIASSHIGWGTKKKRKTHRGIDGNNAYKKVQKSCTFIF